MELNTQCLLFYIFLIQTGNDILISHICPHGFEDELNTFVTFLKCWFTRPSITHVKNTRKLNLLNISTDFFFPKHANF